MFFPINNCVDASSRKKYVLDIKDNTDRDIYVTSEWNSLKYLNIFFPFINITCKLVKINID